jgi:MFS family permease
VVLSTEVAESSGVPAGPDLPRRRRLLVIGSLSLVSNIGYTFLFLTVGTILLGRGVALGTVALVNLLGGIYFGRFLIAPVVDRFTLASRLGHYRGWLVPTQVVLIGLLVGLSAVDPVANFPVLMTLMALVLVVTVFHDTAMSGLMVRLLPPADRGLGNGIGVASASASMLIGSSGALLLYTHAGWRVAVLAIAAVFAIPLAVLARSTESPAERAEHPRAPWRELASYFRRPRMALWALVVIPVFAVSEWLASAPRSAMLLDAGWTMDRIALVGSLVIAVQVVAALATGAAITRFGRWQTALVLGVLGIVSVAATLPLAGGAGSLVPTASAMVAVTVVYTAKLTWIGTVSMDLARPSSAATDYTVPMSIEGVFVTVVSSAGLGLAGAVGFPWLVGGAVGFAVVGAMVAPAWIHWHTRTTRPSTRVRKG